MSFCQSHVLWLHIRALTNGARVTKKKNRKQKTCRHCISPSKVLFGKGLCWPCYRTATANEPKTVKRPKSSRAGKERQGRLPKSPTHHEPGTVEKMAVMSERVRRGETCFHPRDAKAGDAVENRRNQQLKSEGDDE